MATYLQARKQVLALVPALKGWKTWLGVPAQGASPPWVVVSFTEFDRQHTESLATTSHVGRLDIRVVGETDESIGIVCGKLQAALDGAWPGNGFSKLVPERDSGVYSAELVSPLTGSPFAMRVLTWTVGWPN